MVTEENKKVNWYDKFTSKKEVALGLVTLSFGGLATVVLADQALLALALKTTSSVTPELWTLFIANTGILIGWLLGKKDKGE